PDAAQARHRRRTARPAPARAAGRDSARGLIVDHDPPTIGRGLDGLDLLAVFIVATFERAAEPIVRIVPRRDGAPRRVHVVGAIVQLAAGCVVPDRVALLLTVVDCGRRDPG